MIQSFLEGRPGELGAVGQLVEHDLHTLRRQGIQQCHVLVTEIEDAGGAADLVHRVAPLCHIAQNQLAAARNVFPDSLQNLGQLHNHQTVAVAASLQKGIGLIRRHDAGLIVFGDAHGHNGL